MPQHFQAMRAHAGLAACANLPKIKINPVHQLLMCQSCCCQEHKALLSVLPNPGCSRPAAAAEGKGWMQQNWPQQRVTALTLVWVDQSTPGCLQTLLAQEDVGYPVKAHPQGQAAPVSQGLCPWGKAGGEQCHKNTQGIS